jgi:hypothetical protein
MTGTRRPRHLRIVVPSSPRPEPLAVPLSRNAALVRHLDAMVRLRRVNPARADAIMKLTERLVGQAERGRRVGQR